jgi:chromosome segregation ATPase
MAEDQEKAIAPTPGKLCACGKPTRKSGKGRYRAQCSTCESKGEGQLREDLVVTVVEKTKLKARIKQLETSLRERNEENTKLEQAIAEMVPTIERLEASLSDKNQLVADAKAGNARLAKTLEETIQKRELLDGMLTSAEKHKGEVERLEALLGKTQEEAGHLRRDSQKKIDTLTAEAEERNGINKDLMLKIVEKNGQIQLLSDQARELEDRVEKLDKTMASTKILLESRRLQICRLSDELEEVKAEGSNLRDELATTRASMSEAVLAERAVIALEREKASAEQHRSAKVQGQILSQLDQAVTDSLKVQAKLRLVSTLALVELVLIGLMALLT